MENGWISDEVSIKIGIIYTVLARKKVYVHVQYIHIIYNGVKSGLELLCHATRHP